MAVIFHKSFSVSTHETKKIVAIFSYFRSSLKVIETKFSLSWMELPLPLYSIRLSVTAGTGSYMGNSNYPK